MSWEMVRLDDICNAITCGVAKRPEYQEHGVPFLSSLNVKENRFILKSYKYISELDHEQLTKYNKPENGDILYTRVGSFGEAAVIDLDFDFSIFVSLTLIKPNQKLVDSRFLMWHLNSPNVRNFATRNTSGIGVQNLNVGVVREFQIPLPPLPIQKRIAEILDAADTLRRKDQELLKKYDELAQAIFIDMFGDPVKNEKGWEVKRLGNITKVSSGSTPSRQTPSYFEGNIPWVKTTEVKGEIIFSTEEAITEEAIANSSCKLFPKDSVIIAMYGQGKTRGQVGILGIEATTNQACGVILPCRLLNPKFLFNYLKLSYNELRNLGRGGNQENLNKGMIEDFLVILPPVELQLKFNHIVDLLFFQKSISNNQKSDNLFQTLLQKAFKGELSESGFSGFKNLQD